MAHLKQNGIFLGALLILGMLVAIPASAHHSVQAEFDIHKTITVSGTVLKIENINPHSYLTLMAKDANGADQRWGFEFGGAGALRKAGLGKDGLKPGDQITIKALAAKDGSTNGLLRSMTLAAGQVINIASGDPNEDKQ